MNTRDKNTAITALALLAILFILPGCQKKSRGPYSDHRLLLGTFINITDYDSTADAAVVRQAVDSAFAAMQRVERHTNPFDSSAEVARINRLSGQRQSFVVSPLLAALLRESLAIARQTGGAYDPTLWQVFRLWHFGTDSARVPPPERIRKQLSRVDYRRLFIEDHHLRFSRPGMGIDLSGISKGFAVERARETMKRFGLHNFIIDAGGNLGIEWHHARPITVYVRHPRKTGAFFGRFPVAASCGIATSGDYQNFFREDSVLYHHILNPRTGYPARGVVSVTVLAPDATLADGLSTALFVMGREKGLAFAESHPGIEALFIYRRGDSLAYTVSSGLKERFRREKARNMSD